MGYARGMRETRRFEVGTAGARRWAPAIVGLASWFLAPTALAATLYVDASAPPGGDGSMGAPFDDLQPALDAAQPGDQIIVQPGTYSPFSTVRDGTQQAPITITAMVPGDAIVQADGRAADLAHTFHVLDGLVLDGGYGAQDTVRADGAHDLVLRHVEVRRSGADCIDLRSTHRVRIEASSIHHCVAESGGQVADAHGVTGDSVLGLAVVDTEIFLASGDAIQLSPSREPWTDLVVERCVFWTGPLDEAAGPIPAGTTIGENALDTKVGDMGDGNGGAPKVRVSDVVAYGYRDVITNQAAFNLKEDIDAVLDRLTVYDSEIAFRLRAPAAVVVSNAVVYEVDKAFRLEDGLAGARIVHATLGGGIAQAFQDAGGSPVDLAIENLLVLGDAVPPPADASPSNLAVDAGAFVDAAGHDYHLVAGAAPVDAAGALPPGVVVDADRDGTARPQGPAADVGAYEWSEGGGTTTTGDSAGTTAESTAGGTTAGGTAGATAGGTAGATGAQTGTGDAGSTGGTSGQGAAADGGCGCRSTQPPPGALASPWMLLLSLRRRRATR